MTFKITHLLPYLGPFIIFLGVIRLIVYYSLFGVNIISFLSFSEILTSFLDILLVIILFASQIIIQSLFIMSNKDREVNKNLINRIRTENRFIKRLLMYLELYTFFIGLYIVYNIITFIRSFFEGIDPLRYLYAFVGLVFILLVYILTEEIKIRHIKLNHKTEYQIFIRILLIAIGISLFVSLLAYMQAEVTRRGNSTTIILDDNTRLISNKQTYYIGNTQDYLFIHDSKTESTRVIPMTRVKEIMLSKQTPAYNIIDL